MPTVLWKAIKPRQFRSEAIFTRLQGAMERTVKEADDQFKKTYKTWDHQPAFTTSVKGTRSSIVGTCGTSNQIYRWLNDGTKGPYRIPKAGPGLLVFPSGYKAKTTPRILFSKSGGAYGSPVFVRGQVEHPGIEAREFSKTVAIYVKPWFEKWVADALKVGARESGHGTK